MPFLMEPSMTQDVWCTVVMWCTGLPAGKAQRAL